MLVKIKGRPFNIAVIQCYAPTCDSLEEEVDTFYEHLGGGAMMQCKSQEIKIVMGYWNAKVGNSKLRNVVGKHGLGEQNGWGERFCEWCKNNGQVIMNTWFELHPRNLYTWKSPGDSYQN